jgi:hypothetical protein
MARRLVEAGVTFVTMVMENPNPPGGLPKHVSYNWDSHAVNGHIFDDARYRLPLYDQAVTALVEDLHARSLTRRVVTRVAGTGPPQAVIRNIEYDAKNQRTRVEQADGMHTLITYDKLTFRVSRIVTRARRRRRAPGSDRFVA